jgi:hypothetical protein
MYKSRYIQYVNLPSVPEEIIQSLPVDIDVYEKHTQQNYHWTDSFNEKLNAWAQENISQEIYFAFQLMTGDLPPHKDIGTLTKFVYILNTGGSNVVTKFWDDDFNLLDEYIIEPQRWHILKADTYHSVEGIEADKFRWSVTARIF